MYIMRSVWIFTCLQKSLCAAPSALLRSVSPLDWEQMASSDWTAAGDDSVTPVSQSDYFAECCGRSFLANASWPRICQTLVTRRLVSANRFGKWIQCLHYVLAWFLTSGSLAVVYSLLHSGIWSKIFRYSHMYIHIILFCRSLKRLWHYCFFHVSIKRYYNQYLC